MLTTVVSLSDIDFDNREYELFNSEPDSKLEISISTLGVVNPVKLVKKGNCFVVITGWKRLNALKKLELDKVNSQVYENSELSPLQLFTYIYIDNKERITDLEKAELLLKLIKTDTLTEEEIIEDFLPILGINPSLNNLNKFRSIASLEKELKEACFNELITFEQLQLLSEIEDPEFRTGFYNHFLKQFSFNNNEARDFLKDVQAICMRNNISVSQVAEQLLNESNKKQDKNTVRKTVKTLCYPRLSETEQKYNKIVKELNLSSYSRLVNHPYFESNDLELRIKFKNQEDLKSVLESLKQSIDEGKIEKLLKLIKEGI